MVPCVVRATLFGSSGEASVERPCAFGPRSAGWREGVVVVPNAGLWGAARRVRGQRFEPGGFTRLRQCTDTEGTSTASRAGSSFPSTPSAGSGASPCSARSQRRRRRRTVHRHVLPGGRRRSGRRGASRSTPNEARPSVPACRHVRRLADGRMAGRAGAQRRRSAEVERAGAEIVGPDGADSVVVIHGVARLRNCAPGVGAGTVEPSFSMSVVHVDGDRPARRRRQARGRPAARADRGMVGARRLRRAITLRHLLNMASGLQWNGTTPAPSDVISMVLAPGASAYAVARPLRYPRARCSTTRRATRRCSARSSGGNRTRLR